MGFLERWPYAGWHYGAERGLLRSSGRASFDEWLPKACRVFCTSGLLLVVGLLHAETWLHFETQGLCTFIWASPSLMRRHMHVLIVKESLLIFWIHWHTIVRIPKFHGCGINNKDIKKMYVTFGTLEDDMCFDLNDMLWDPFHASWGYCQYCFYLVLCLNINISVVGRVLLECQWSDSAELHYTCSTSFCTWSVAWTAWL